MIHVANPKVWDKDFVLVVVIDAYRKASTLNL